MSLRFHEIAEQQHRILNPFSEVQLALLGEICQIQHGMQQIDLCCGKGEMLCSWSAKYGLAGVGVDISPVFLRAAHQRAAELQCQERVTFVEADAGSYPIESNSYDIVSCIGATWIGNGLTGTLELMRPALRDRESLLLVGEPYWIETPPDEAYAAVVDGDREMYTSLAGTHERIEAAGFELVEMVLADQQGWDRYVARQWIAISNWLRNHADDPDAAALWQWNEKEKHAYLTYGRRYFSWGVFVLRQR